MKLTLASSAQAAAGSWSIASGLADVSSAEFEVFVGGSSSFDLAPRPYNKYYALVRFCRENGISFDDVIYVGDDPGEGGNDEPVYRAGVPFVLIDDYRKLPEKLAFLLPEPVGADKP